MMAIELSCTGCGRTLRVADDAAGKHARCPACGQVSRIPEPAGAEMASAWTIDPHSHGLPSGYAPGKYEPPANPFADSAPAKPSSPYDPPGTNPFGDGGSAKETGNPYQAPSAFGYTPPAGYHLPLASRGRRFAGHLVDYFFLMIGAAPGFLLMMAAAEQSEEAALAGFGVMFLGMFLVGIVNWVMITRSGQSIAKKMLGMRIVRFDNGELPGFVNGVLLRSWVPILINQACNLFALLDALWIFGEERRCIHDLIAQTVVIDV